MNMRSRSSAPRKVVQKFRLIEGPSGHAGPSNLDEGLCTNGVLGIEPHRDTALHCGACDVFWCIAAMWCKRQMRRRVITG